MKPYWELSIDDTGAIRMVSEDGMWAIQTAEFDPWAHREVGMFLKGFARWWLRRQLRELGS